MKKNNDGMVSLCLISYRQLSCETVILIYFDLFLFVIFHSMTSLMSDSWTRELRQEVALFFFFFLCCRRYVFSSRNVMPLIRATETVLDVYTLNQTSQEFSYLDFVIRYSF